MRQPFYTGFLSFLILILLTSCQEETELEPLSIKPEKAFNQLESPNTPGVGPRIENPNTPGSGPRICLDCPSKVPSNPPLIILVKNGKESIEGSLSDVNLQEVERFEVVKLPQLPEKFKVYGKDAIILHLKD